MQARFAKCGKAFNYVESLCPDGAVTVEWAPNFQVSVNSELVATVTESQNVVWAPRAPGLLGKESDTVLSRELQAFRRH